MSTAYCNVDGAVVFVLRPTLIIFTLFSFISVAVVSHAVCVAVVVDPRRQRVSYGPRWRRQL